MENAFLMEQLCSSTDFANTLKNGDWKFYSNGFFRIRDIACHDSIMNSWSGKGYKKK